MPTAFPLHIPLPGLLPRPSLADIDTTTLLRRHTRSLFKSRFTNITTRLSGDKRIPVMGCPCSMDTYKFFNSSCAVCGAFSTSSVGFRLCPSPEFFLIFDAFSRLFFFLSLWSKCDVDAIDKYIHTHIHAYKWILKCLVCVHRRIIAVIPAHHPETTPTTTNIATPWYMHLCH